MKFNPFGKKYKFKQDVLISNFPSYFYKPISNWLFGVLESGNVIFQSNRYGSYGVYYANSKFIDKFQITFRELFPQKFDELVSFIIQEQDRTTNFLAFCLQNFSNSYQALELEKILSEGGSAYEVIQVDKKTSEYEKGGHDLAERVSPIVKKESEKALSENEILQSAWVYCYSQNPDYEKTVSRSCDFLEGFLGKLYFPKDPKPQLTKFVYAFESNPEKLTYKGESIVVPKSNLTSLLREASNIRGQHTKGKGRKPTKQEAEFILHTTIYIWNLHKK
ncbi:MAG: hypothetical protein COZ34_01355 [Candidatus Pacebacteria bacterium CG_4_10_14_3_um_filter_34_15]|nr:hypothetical protein [Candidatus Paceibacterota bacterium]NCS86395.1 hypothetical protein [Candidatus Paceibacterota bacterium]OIO44623.1 MAG: hypothetical protein AUJ41_02375 [Candidatus Pacebacteria bacterium CG1_02_43_31]PIX81905.1 MAG: hypothetical protein COZ34_01355 [Candidatus Pacebacteria bacterium CG_4_10_14_3_um_filter_34_15]